MKSHHWLCLVLGRIAFWALRQLQHFSDLVTREGRQEIHPLGYKTTRFHIVPVRGARSEGT